MTTLAGMPTGVTALGVSAFKGCSALQDLGDSQNNTGLPQTLSVIQDCCFAECTAIKYIKLTRNTSGTNRITGLADYQDAGGHTKGAVFNYGTLNDNINLHIYVPVGAAQAYEEVWAASFRFDADKISTFS